MFDKTRTTRPGGENLSKDTKITFNKLKESRAIHDSHLVRVTKMNHIIEVLRSCIQHNENVIKSRHGGDFHGKARI